MSAVTCPTREEFVAARLGMIRDFHGREPDARDSEDAGKVYDLLSGPPAAFRDAMEAWAREWAGAVRARHAYESRHEGQP